jgi:hypothetical protein
VPTVRFRILAQQESKRKCISRGQVETTIYQVASWKRNPRLTRFGFWERCLRCHLEVLSLFPRRTSH